MGKRASVTGTLLRARAPEEKAMLARAFEAASGPWSGATRVVVDMSEGNFFARYFSGLAYVRELSQADSYLELPVTVPAAGTYTLEIGSSTAGSQESRRAHIPPAAVRRTAAARSRSSALLRT